MVTVVTVVESPSASFQHPALQARKMLKHGTPLHDWGTGACTGLHGVTQFPYAIKHTARQALTSSVKTGDVVTVRNVNSKMRIDVFIAVRICKNMRI